MNCSAVFPSGHARVQSWVHAIALDRGQPLISRRRIRHPDMITANCPWFTLADHALWRHRGPATAADRTTLWTGRSSTHTNESLCVVYMEHPSTTHNIAATDQLDWEIGVK